MRGPRLAIAALLLPVALFVPSADARQAAAVFVQPNAIAVADVNRDGALDVLTADESPGGISVLLGNGHGSFAATARYDSGGPSEGIAVADFNRDGALDVVVSHADSSSVSILRGRGDGTFGLPEWYDVGKTPFALAAMDVNGDGFPDVVTANNDSNDVSLLVGRGDGTFTNAQSFRAGETPFGILLADLDGDGRVDIATPGWNGPGVASLLLQTGLGLSFSRRDVPAGTPEPISISSGDFNGDHVLDLVVARDRISILPGLGEGRFGRPSTIGAKAMSWGLAPADFNRDGRLDLATAAGDAVFVLLGNGRGQLRRAVEYRAGVNAHALVAADLNGDGNTDLAVANYASGDVSVLAGRGDGSFRRAVAHALGALQRCGVPKLAGMKLADAREALLNAGCALGRVTRRRSAAPAGRVIAQAPPPGAQRRHGFGVAVVVSRGHR